MFRHKPSVRRNSPAPGDFSKSWGISQNLRNSPGIGQFPSAWGTPQDLGKSMEHGNMSEQLMWGLHARTTTKQTFPQQANNLPATTNILSRTALILGLSIVFLTDIHRLFALDPNMRVPGTNLELVCFYIFGKMPRCPKSRLLKVC